MFRFTIREIVLVTVIVAMGVALWLNARHGSRVEGERKVWQERAYYLRSQLTGPDSEIYSITFAEDGTTLVTLKNKRP